MVYLYVYSILCMYICVIYTYIYMHIVVITLGFISILTRLNHFKIKHIKTYPEMNQHEYGRTVNTNAP